MTKVYFLISPHNFSKKRFKKLLEDGEVIEAIAHNNHRHFNRSATELLEEAGLEHILTEDNSWDDTGTHIDLTVVYPNLDATEVEKRLQKIDDKISEKYGAELVYDIETAEDADVSVD